MLQMGHTLQKLLTTVDYSEVGGQNNIEWDAVHVPSAFLVMWLLRPDTLRSLSCHWDTTQPLSQSEVDNIIKGMSMSLLPYRIVVEPSLFPYYWLNGPPDRSLEQATFIFCN